MDATRNEDNTLLGSYLTKAQLARALGRSSRTIDRWHTLRIGPRRTKLPRTKVILYHRDHVQAWIAAHAEEQT